MQNAPAFQMYAKDWLVKTECFSPETRGLFLVLILQFWVSDTQDRIPNDDEMICLDLKIPEEEWAKMKRIAVKKGLLIEDEDGFLIMPELTKVLEQQQDRRDRNKENGKKGGRPKTQNNPEVNSGLAKKRPSSPTPSSTSTAVDLSPTPQVENSGLAEGEISCEFQKKAVEYIQTQTVDHPNVHDVRFAKGYVSIEFPKLQTEKINAQAVLDCWIASVDIALSNCKTSTGFIGYLKKTFQNKVAEWTPNQPKLRAVPGAGSPYRPQGTVLSKVVPAHERTGGISQA